MSLLRLVTRDFFWQECPGGFYLVIKITTRFTGYRSILDIGYNCNFMKVLGFIDTEGTVPGDTYLSCFPENNYNVSIRSVVNPSDLGSYLNSCNTTENHNNRRQYDPSLEKYWVT